MTRKNALGRGLGALIPEYPEEKVEKPSENSLINTELSTNQSSNVKKTVDKGEIIREVAISQVEPRPSQPRVLFDEAALRELADSIGRRGLLQPILVVPKDDHFEIAAGERRWRAAKMAGLTKIPVIVRELSEQELTEVALIENIQREDLNPIAEAQAYRQLMNDFSLKQDELAEKVSKSRSAVANSLRLLKLDERVQAMVMDGSLSEGHARALLGLNDKKKQLSAAKEIAEKALSGRETERLVKRLNQPPKGEGPDWRDADRTAYDEWELRLRKTLGTKVTIRRSEPDKGQIVIDYYSVEDLERITERLK